MFDEPHGLRALPAAVGAGLVAGAAGTAAMTLSSTLEMRWRGREPSAVPARAAAKVLGVQPTGEAERQRFATIVHWGYGTGWGAMRGVIGAAGCRGPRAAALFFATVWASELVTLPLLAIGVPPVWRWSPAEIGIDAVHHLVYATVTSVVYERLT
jgi:hypothetical protein